MYVYMCIYYFQMLPHEKLNGSLKIFFKYDSEMEERNECDRLSVKKSRREVAMCHVEITNISLLRCYLCISEL